MNAIIDWLSREGYIIVSWWLLVTLAGIAALPFCWRVLSGLPDKGYTLARPLGLLLVAFTYWILASFGLVQNATGAMAMAWLLVLAIGVWWYTSRATLDWRAYWQTNRWHILFTELLFLVLFVGWAIFRAYQNDTATTEKPMELAFISGIMRSEAFPPNDPWMAGYSISYYHFGYIMAAMLSRLSGVSSAIGFSMTNALWFALTGVTAFGVVYNMVRSRWGRLVTARIQVHATIAGVLALIFINLLSNFQFALIEVPFQSSSMPNEWFDFWGIQERTQMSEFYSPQNNSLTITNPETWSYWWFFRASRVLTDYELDGTLMPGAQPIDEFPAFSFLLGDVHPHVLALPFAIMFLGLAFNLILREHDPDLSETVFYGLVGGGLIFLNTWDGPIYMLALVGALALRRLLHSQNGRLGVGDWLSLVRFGVGLLVIALLAYLPFLIGFRSQASGLVPNPLYPTYFPHFFLMFGPLLLLGGGFVLLELWRGIQQRRMNWMLGWSTAGVTLLVLLVLMITMTVMGALITPDAGLIQGYVSSNGGWGEVISSVIQRRMIYLPTTLLLVTTLAVLIARLFPRLQRKAIEDKTTGDEQPPFVTYSRATGFALLLVGIAVSMTLIPEFLYLRDNFGSRINTIFKFYYQAWIALSLVSAYGVYAVLLDDSEERPAGWARTVYGGVLIVVLILGGAYSIFGVHARTMIETNRFALAPADLPPLTLDGSSRMTLSPEDYQMVQCLNTMIQTDDVVVVEAVQHAYRSYYARVGSITGIPILLGWENHERQWRGVTYDEAAGGRSGDIERLYNDVRWDFTQEIINRYGIDYVVYGRTERQQYDPAGEAKFQEYTEPVCEFGDSVVYRIGDSARISVVE